MNSRTSQRGIPLAERTGMRVGELMTSDVRTIEPGESCHAALARMAQARIRHLPVVDAERLVGIVTDRDLRHRPFTLNRFSGTVPVEKLLKSTFVCEVMSAPVVTVGPDQDVETAARRMYEHEVSSLPVVDTGRIVGIVTETDLLRQIVGAEAGDPEAQNREIPLAVTDGGGLPPSGLRSVIDHIEAHLGDDLPLHRLAELIQMTPSHFARLFKQSLGLAPHQYVLRQRIARAKHLLAQRSPSLPEIAYRLGFSNQPHFTTMFRKVVGVTPGLYRRKRGEESSALGRKLADRPRHLCSRRSSCPP